MGRTSLLHHGGQLTIDNNTTEGTLHHQAIGRNNWLFIGG
jgi:hypothetical protein